MYNPVDFRIEKKNKIYSLTIALNIKHFVLSSNKLWMTSAGVLLAPIFLSIRDVLKYFPNNRNASATSSAGVLIDECEIGFNN